jgi:DNA mismatch endonuclease (patch repair protein)
MVDNRSPEKRSATMRAVRGKDTRPEWVVRRLLHRNGYRYRVHRKDLPGKPDLAFAGRRAAIFVHGCFWHGHACAIGQPPKSRLDYWLPKLEQNKARDVEKVAQLQSLGWSVLTVWQCQTGDEDTLQQLLRAFLGPPRDPRPDHVPKRLTPRKI